MKPIWRSYRKREARLLGVPLMCMLVAVSVKSGLAKAWSIGLPGQAPPLHRGGLMSPVVAELRQSLSRVQAAITEEQAALRSPAAPEIKAIQHSRLQRLEAQQQQLKTLLETHVVDQLEAKALERGVTQQPAPVNAQPRAMPPKLQPGA